MHAASVVSHIVPLIETAVVWWWYRWQRAVVTPIAVGAVRVTVVLEGHHHRISLHEHDQVDTLPQLQQVRPSSSRWWWW